MEGYIGQIILFAGNFAPLNWAYCNGQLLSIPSNTALFSILGASYGGDGTKTFGLPDLRGRIPVGMGQLPGGDLYSQGETIGIERAMLISDQMPSHSHAFTIEANESDGTGQTPAGTYIAGAASNLYVNSSDGTKMGAQTTQINVDGGINPVSIVQPVQGLNYIICTRGTFPTRPHE